MRNPSPISISSPRETTTSRPSASAARARSTAAALLLTTSAASAPRQAPQQLCEMNLARTALPAFEVVLEVRVAAPHLDHSRHRRVCERSPAQVRVHEDAGRVEHAAQRRPPRSCELLEHEVRNRAGVRSCCDVDPGSREDRAGGGNDDVVRRGREPLVTEQLVDGREVAQPHAESVGTSSRRSAVTEPAARAPISSTASCSIFSGRTPAAMFVTTESPRTRIPM